MRPSYLSDRPPRRPSSIAFAALAAGGVAVLLTFADAAWLGRAREAERSLRRELVSQLQLTDLCLFTEARYTRHPSQADLHTPFQDHPFALEHFPSGSLLGPPPGLLQPHDALDRQAALPD